MYSLSEYNTIASNQAQAPDNALLNMALVQSFNYSSDRLSYDAQESISKSVEEARSKTIKLTDAPVVVQNVCEKMYNMNGKHLFGASKDCKYACKMHDLTCPKEKKGINVKSCQDSPEINFSKRKKILLKRAMSEYSITKTDKDKKGEDCNLLKSWQRFFRSQIIMSDQSVESSTYDVANLSLQNVRQESSLITNDFTNYFHRNNYSSQQHLSVSLRDAEPGTSEGIREQNFQSVTLENKLSNESNFNPNANCQVSDTETHSETGDPCHNNLQENIHFGVEDVWYIPTEHHTFGADHISRSASEAQPSIDNFGDGNLPTCKICYTTSKPEDPLISPCRCIGTLKYIHCRCLMRWLEFSNRRSRSPPTCELCKYQFRWQNNLMEERWQYPHCSRQDKILHFIFVISVLTMFGISVAVNKCLKPKRNGKVDFDNAELTQFQVIFTQTCGAIFFLAFFLALYVEIKAKKTIFKLMLEFIYLN
ncbi:RING-CH-type domain-containing protein [Caerostris darwini]|uniref:RING-CH-type domain-containing protein n=1 Tax=Caerostris darwini TaxID=1538125 RepID=A0AAV4TE38_9ARAC|nr:RING-CH-type domain-containing protein [Caerostris darwini]